MKLFFYAAFFLSAFFLNVFSQDAFVQHEAVGQAYYWVSNPVPFWIKFFTHFIQGEGGTGRFRFLEYLSQAAQWNLIAKGYLPNGLYDYFSLFFSLVIAGFIYAFAFRRLKHRETSLIYPILFLLGSPTALVILFHYRQAKVLASLALVLLAWLSREESPGKVNRGCFSVISFLGIFTDPSFIFLAPIVVFFGHRWLERESALKLKILALGYLIGFGVVILLNGLIGPRLTPFCGLIPNINLLHPHPRFMSIQNLSSVFYLPGELLFPLLGQKSYVLSSLVAWIIFFLLFRIRPSSEKKYRPWSLTFLCSLPVCAFLVRADPSVGEYASYYGYILFTFFICALTEVEVPSFNMTLYPSGFLTIKSGLMLALFLSIGGIHFYSQRCVLSNWQGTHVLNSRKYALDEKEYVYLRNHSKFDSPYRLILPNFPIHVQGQFPARFGDVFNELPRSAFAYFLLPVLFYKQIEQGEIKIVSLNSRSDNL